MTDEEKKSTFENYGKFIAAANSAIKKRGVVYRFVCPICGGEAHAARASCNGHMHAGCSKCGFGVME